MILIGCGSRGFSNRALVRAKLEGAVRYTREKGLCDDLDRVLVIEGGARGADRLVREEAQALGYETKTVDADWEQNGNQAGPIRNQAMLDLQPDLVLAFILDPPTPGTSHMIKISKAAGVPTYVVREGS